MGAATIRVTELCKSFRVARQPQRSLKETAIRLLTRRLEYDTFLALDKVTLEIRAGEAVAIIGANGSGKSTLFKLISGILRPTSGTVHVSGRVSPLIELSSGFHPELSGVENVYLNGAIFGMRRAEIAARLGAIERFADIGDFIYAPVRTYSSGMLARLAFAVAINVEADALLIDEVLAVGDAQFQARCLAKIDELKATGVTIVYVSHDMGSVERIADKVVLLEHGRVRRTGAARPVIEEYLAAAREGSANAAAGA